MKILTTLAVVLGLAGSAWAQSLYSDGVETTSTSSPYDPPQRPPHQKHDHIQILVLERSRALTTTELRTDRRTRWETELDEWIRFGAGDGAAPKLRSAALLDDPAIDLDARLRQDSSGRTARQFDLSFTITAEVIDVRPNGILVLQARKNRKINDDEETIKLSGEVSPEAILGGKVASDSIVNLNITYEGSGSVSDSSKQGFLGWLLNKLWPF